MHRGLNIKREFSVERRALPATESLCFDLPFPISTNALFANVPGIGRVKAKAYRAWLKEAGGMIMAQRLGRIDGPVNVEIVLQEGRKTDPDNTKCLLDVCVRHGLIKDDGPTIIRSINTSFGQVQGARIKIVRAA